MTKGGMSSSEDDGERCVNQQSNGVGVSKVVEA